MKVVIKKDKAGEFSPALAVASSLDCEGGGVSGGSLGLCLWAEM